MCRSISIRSDRPTSTLIWHGEKGGTKQREKRLLFPPGSGRPGQQPRCRHVGASLQFTVPRPRRLGLSLARSRRPSLHLTSGMGAPHPASAQRAGLLSVVDLTTTSNACMMRDGGGDRPRSPVGRSGTGWPRRPAHHRPSAAACQHTRCVCLIDLI